LQALQVVREEQVRQLVTVQVVHVELVALRKNKGLQTLQVVRVEQVKQLATVQVVHVVFVALKK
jgi:hypothetical protein